MADRGRTRISERALRRIVGAVAADALGVSADRVAVDLADTRGLLDARVRGPLRFESLEAVAAQPRLVADSGGTVVDRAEACREAVVRRVAELTGSQVGRVTVRLTSVEVGRMRRVR